jgi:hypothetical protein
LENLTALISPPEVRASKTFAPLKLGCQKPLQFGLQNRGSKKALQFRGLADTMIFPKMCDMSVTVERAGIRSGDACIIVGDSTVESISVVTDATTLGTGESLQAHCIGSLDDGSEYDLTEDAAWRSSSPETAWVSNIYRRRGVVTAVSSATSTETAISCHYEGLADSISLTVDAD